MKTLWVGSKNSLQKSWGKKERNYSQESQDVSVGFFCLLHTSGFPWFQMKIRLKEFHFNVQPAAVHLNKMRSDRLRIWKVPEDNWIPDIKWEACLSQKMEGTIFKSCWGFLSPRFGASTIPNNDEKRNIAPIVIITTRKLLIWIKPSCKNTDVLLRRLWSVLKLLESEWRCWGSSCTRLRSSVKVNDVRKLLYHLAICCFPGHKIY